MMSGRFAPGRRAVGAAGRLSFADFVADNTANGCATDGSEHTAARKNGPSDGTDTSTNGGVLALDGCAFAEPPSASVFLGTWSALPRLAAACLARSIENLPVGRKKL
jgi:hypothetical protein